MKTYDNFETADKKFTFAKQDLSLRLAEAYLKGFERFGILECDEEVARRFYALYDYIVGKLTLPYGVDVVDEYVTVVLEKSEAR